MTGIDSKRQAALDKLFEVENELVLSYEPEPKQELVACKKICELCVKRGYDFCANAAKTTPIYTTPQQQEPRNFCPRCGKRTADLTVIHTCTPPEGGHQ
jgi:hypothetical protein